MGGTPPPLPPYGFAPKEPETLPGVGHDLLTLHRENGRLRRERNEAIRQLEARSSVPPPRGRAQVALRVGGQWALLLPVVALVGRAASKQWPEITEAVDAILGLLGI